MSGRKGEKNDSYVKVFLNLIGLGGRFQLRQRFADLANELIQNLRRDLKLGHDHISRTWLKGEVDQTPMRSN